MHGAQEIKSFTLEYRSSGGDTEFRSNYRMRFKDAGGTCWSQDPKQKNCFLSNVTVLFQHQYQLWCSYLLFKGCFSHSIPPIIKKLGYCMRLTLWLCQRAIPEPLWTSRKQVSLRNFFWGSLRHWGNIKYPTILASHRNTFLEATWKILKLIFPVGSVL